MNKPESNGAAERASGSLERMVRRRECPHCHGNLERYEDPKAVEIIGTLEKEIADNERWMREVLTDFRIPFDDHKIGRRLAFTQWMFERQSSNTELSEPGGPVASESTGGVAPPGFAPVTGSGAGRK